MRNFSFDGYNACEARPLTSEWEITFQNGLTKNAGRLINVMVDSQYETIHQALLADTIEWTSLVNIKKY